MDAAQPAVHLITERAELEAAMDIVHRFVGGHYAKVATIPAGMLAVQHKHEYDHDSVLAIGEVLLQADGAQTHLVAPAIVKIKAGVHHSVQALCDSLWLCIHRTDETDPAKVDELVIAKGG